MISFLIELAKRDLSERFAGSILGAAWAFIWPAVQLFIYIVIFGKLMSGRLPGSQNIYSYGLYVASGLIPWTSFFNVVSRSSGIFSEKRHIISKINVSLASFPIFVVIAEGVIFLFSISILILFVAIAGYRISEKLLLLPFIYYLQQIFAFSLGLLFGTFSVFFKDLKQIIDIGLQLWFWFTPIVYVKQILPQTVQKIIHLNPMYIFIETYHRIFLEYSSLEFPFLFLMNFISHILLFFSVFLLKLLEKDVRDFL